VCSSQRTSRHEPRVGEADGEAEARAAGPRAAVELLERLEHPREVLLSDAYPVSATTISTERSRTLAVMRDDDATPPDERSLSTNRRLQRRFADPGKLPGSVERRLRQDH
jgi:hypothetical protein